MHTRRCIDKVCPMWRELGKRKMGGRGMAPMSVGGVVTHEEECLIARMEKAEAFYVNKDACIWIASYLTFHIYVVEMVGDLIAPALYQGPLMLGLPCFSTLARAASPRLVIISALFHLCT